MDDVERKLEVKRQAAARAKLQERILHQAEYVQQQLDEQEQMQMLAMQQQAQQERQLRQQAAIVQEQRIVAATRPVPPQNVPVVRGNSAGGANVNPLQLAENLKKSVASGVNGLLTATPREQPPTLPKPVAQNMAVQNTAVQNNAKSKATGKIMEVAVTPPALPGRPPVSPVTQEYGLLPEEEYDGIMQAQFTADNVPIRP
jgi:transcription initiation factor TFIID subunit TAF12